MVNWINNSPLFQICDVIFIFQDVRLLLHKCSLLFSQLKFQAFIDCAKELLFSHLKFAYKKDIAASMYDYVWPIDDIGEKRSLFDLLFDLMSWSIYYSSCYLPPRRRPGTGDIEMPPIHLSVCLSITFGFRTNSKTHCCIFSKLCKYIHHVMGVCCIVHFFFHFAFYAISNI